MQSGLKSTLASIGGFLNLPCRPGHAGHRRNLLGRRRPYHASMFSGRAGPEARRQGNRKRLFKRGSRSVDYAARNCVRWRPLKAPAPPRVVVMRAGQWKALRQEPCSGSTVGWPIGAPNVAALIQTSG